MKRREFLKGAAALGAFNIVPAKVLWGATAPSNQLTRALIGFGEIAHSANHLPFQGSRLVGLTDCYAPRVAAGLAAASTSARLRTGTASRASWRRRPARTSGAKSP